MCARPFQVARRLFAGTLTNTALPVVTSIPQQGGLLGASTGLWQGIPSSYAYQWNRCDQNGLNCSPIVGATGQNYAMLAPADPLATLVRHGYGVELVRVSFRDI